MLSSVFISGWDLRSLLLTLTSIDSAFLAREARTPLGVSDCGPVPEVGWGSRGAVTLSSYTMEA